MPASFVNAKCFEKVTLDGFYQGMVRHTLKNMYVERRALSTLTIIGTALHERLVYSGSREHLRAQLKRMGSSYKKCENNKKETIKNKHEEIIMLKYREKNPTKLQELRKENKE